MGNATLRKEQQTKYESVLQDAVNKVNGAVEKLCKETETTLYAEIQQVGNALVKIKVKATPLSRIWFIRNRQKKAITSKIEAFNFRYKTICDENGVVPMAKITVWGAQLCYGLSQEKAKALENAIIPVEKPKLIIAR
jgi:stage V sporulation protein SpoVS